VQVGEEMVMVRHYSGQWFPEGLPEADTIQFPLPSAQLEAMRKEIATTGFVPQIYGAAEIR
jgi:hypothetical protein